MRSPWIQLGVPSHVVGVPTGITDLDAILILLTAVKDGLARMRPPAPTAHPPT
ncbi:hypothetical protein EV642_10371 [Kribbella sp. VKM Ac-2500]|nr:MULTISPECIES: hypothetical protein [Kribbella]TCN41689.1 hypothetical protein EV642_10371 [Kribbella sp. VKM Ac-2500]